MSIILSYFNFKTDVGTFFYIYSDKFLTGETESGTPKLCYLGIGEDNFYSYMSKIKKEYDDLNLCYKQNHYIELQIMDFLKGESDFINIETYFLTGTEFEKAVWNKTKEIGYGKTLSYKQVSEEVCHLVGKPKSYRAVGNALGKNPIILIIPCHRVIKSNGDVGNFSSGIPLKKMLLELESKSGAS